jgi:hypothetical protein
MADSELTAPACDLGPVTFDREFGFGRIPLIARTRTGAVKIVTIAPVPDRTLMSSSALHGVF